MTTDADVRSAVPPTGGEPHGGGPQVAARERGGRRPLSSFVRHVVMILASLVMIYPLLWMLASSLRSESDIFNTPGLWPLSFVWENYTDGWSALSSTFGHYLLNSAIVTVACIAGNLVSCSLAAYAFARLEFKLKRLWFAVMLMTIMLPIHVIIVPQYVAFSQLGLVNTFWPLIIPKWFATDAFFVFLMVQFIRGIPREIDEAARIDGCGHWKIFSRLILPLMLPALAATAVFTFINTWNDFLSALIYLTSPEDFTVPVALKTFIDSQGSSSWGPMFAMSAVSLVPVFFAFLVGQKYLVKGIATTGGK
jgi:multiple sugar transport system permease protein